MVLWIKERELSLSFLLTIAGVRVDVEVGIPRNGLRHQTTHITTEPYFMMEPY